MFIKKEQYAELVERLVNLESLVGKAENNEVEGSPLSLASMLGRALYSSLNYDNYGIKKTHQSRLDAQKNTIEALAQDIELIKQYLGITKYNTPQKTGYKKISKKK